MIWSVSTLVRRNGTARPVCVTNGSIWDLSFWAERASQVGGRGQAARDSGGGSDGGRYEVSAAALALAALEVPVRGRGAALPGGKRVRVHAKAHRAAGRPPLRAGRGEHLVQAFVLCLRPDLHGARDDQHPDGRGDVTAADDLGGGAQVLDPAVRAGADEYGVHGDVAQRGACRQAHVLQGPPGTSRVGRLFWRRD